MTKAVLAGKLFRYRSTSQRVVEMLLQIYTTFTTQYSHPDEGRTLLARTIYERM